MPQKNHKITELVASLSEDEQSAVLEFIRYLNEKRPSGSKMGMRAALDEFVREHSELLRRLAQ